jgi:zinc transporter 1/2/3
VVGVLLTVTPDDDYIPMFAVILLHQLFEGLALGARISPLEHTSPPKKLLMGLAFSGTCPTGMAIGIGVRRSFNGSDGNTLLTLGTMDALSAGVLAWVAFVELWSADWLHGDLRAPGWRKGAVAMLSLVLGAAGMSVLGKWA